MPIKISLHAKEQMLERGASEEEVKIAVQKGEKQEAKKGRIIYKKNFQFNNHWRGREYKIKQVSPVVAIEGDDIIVITVYVFYF
ncbi:DUF4258 domain-containing protein [bacterium]|nr:DUF4258 domain-containing protein [bacterium]